MPAERPGAAPCVAPSRDRGSARRKPGQVSQAAGFRLSPEGRWAAATNAPRIARPRMVVTVEPSTKRRAPACPGLPAFAATTVVWLSLGLLALPARAQPGIVESIEVHGLARMTRETFLYSFGVKAGDPYDPKRIQARFRKLWDLGAFEDLRIEAEPAAGGGKRLVVFVREKPTLVSVVFGENKVLTRTQIEDRLRERKISLEVGHPLNLKSVYSAESVIRDMLGEKGYLDSTVTHRVDRTPAGASVTFSIHPGAKTRIRRIEFVGNTVYSDRTLREALKITRQWRWWWPLSAKSLYHPAKWDQDSSNIRELYLNAGYLDVEIRPPVLDVKTVVKGGKEKRSARRPEASRPAPDESRPAVVGPAAEAGSERAAKLAERRRRQEDKARRRAEKEEERARPKERRWVVLTVPIVEGPQYRMGALRVSGATVFTEERIRAGLPLREGDVLNRGALDALVKRVVGAYQDQGYAYATARHEIERRAGEPVADVRLVVQEDRQYRVDRIEFSGNSLTQDRVLRRELRLGEGDLYNKSLLDLSVRKINQLGYFEVKREEVGVAPVEGKDRVRITIPGEEKSRNEIQIGGGYSGLDGAFFQGYYATRNFLGRGQILSTSLQVGGRRNLYTIQFQEPYFLGRPYTFGFQLTRSDLEFGRALSSRRQGGGLRLGRLFGHFTEASIRYDLDRLESTSFSLGGQRAVNRISALTPAYAVNTIDNIYRPSRGWSLLANFEVAGGPLGGDTNYLRPQVQTSFYKPLGRRTLVAFHGEVGLIRPWQGGGAGNTATVNGVPRFQRFWLGGDTIGPRIFETRSITPLRFVRLDALGRIVEAVEDPSGRPVSDFDRNGDGVVNRFDLVEMGGDRYYLAQAEYVVRINEPLEVAFFADAGSTLFEDRSWGFDDLRVSAGVEVRFYLPVFPVPLRLIYGVPVRKFAEDRTSGFTFSIGRSF